MHHDYDDFLQPMGLCVYVYLRGNLGRQFHHYLRLVASVHLFEVRSFQFLGFVQVTGNDLNIDQQQYPILLGLDIHDLDMETTKA